MKRGLFPFSYLYITIQCKRKRSISEIMKDKDECKQIDSIFKLNTIFPLLNN